MNVVQVYILCPFIARSTYRWVQIKSMDVNCGI